MAERKSYVVVFVGLMVGLLPSMTHGQVASDLDAYLDGIRAAETLSPNDGPRIREWVWAKLEQLAASTERDALKIFLDEFRRNDRDPRNSSTYRAALARQTANLAVREFAKADLSRRLADGLARALKDTGHIEAYPGLVAGLGAPAPLARHLCASGLAFLQGAIVQDPDKEKLTRTVTVLRDAGVAETDGVVLGAIYRALAYQERPAAVFDAYLAIFDRRLEFRRGAAVIADGAEYDAYEFFRVGRVQAVLSNDQKVALVGRLAVFLRLDGVRYSSKDLESVRRLPAEDGKDGKDGKVQIVRSTLDERTRIEQMLDAVEAILVALVGGGGALRDELRDGGFGRRVQVLQQVYLWVGDSERSKPGVLNAAPWNVPIGAP